MNIYYITRYFYTYNHLHSKQPFKIDVINRRARGGGETVKERGEGRDRKSPTRRWGKSTGNNINDQK